jgi:hypothetical protein
MKKRILIFSIFLDVLLGQYLLSQTYYWPVYNGPATLNSAFGPRNLGSAEYSNAGYDYDFHAGFDLAIDHVSNEVVPVLDGVITGMVTTGNAACVEIKHRYPGETTEFLTLYTHITPTAALVTRYNNGETINVTGGTTVIGKTLDYGTPNPSGGAHPDDHLDFRYFPDGTKEGADANADNPGKILAQTTVGSGLTFTTSNPQITDRNGNVIPVSNNQFYLESDATNAFLNPVNARYFVIGVRIPSSALSVNSIKVSLCGYQGGGYLDEYTLLKNNNDAGSYEYQYPNEAVYYTDELWETYDTWSISCRGPLDSPRWAESIPPPAAALSDSIMK